MLLELGALQPIKKFLDALKYGGRISLFLRASIREIELRGNIAMNLGN
jgi:hypothetical protein